MKDLARLGRPLESTVIVDNIRDNFERQPGNGIEILTWVGDVQDRELQRLAKFLKNLVEREVDDVREGISDFTQETWHNESHL